MDQVKVERELGLDKKPRLWIVVVLAFCGLVGGAETVYRFYLWAVEYQWRIGVNHAYVEPVWTASWVLLILGVVGLVRGGLSKWRRSFMAVMGVYVAVGVLGVGMVKVGGLVDYSDYIQGVYPSR